MIPCNPSGRRFIAESKRKARYMIFKRVEWKYLEVPFATRFFGNSNKGIIAKVTAEKSQETYSAHVVLTVWPAWKQFSWFFPEVWLKKKRTNDNSSFLIWLWWRTKTYVVQFRHFSRKAKQIDMKVYKRNGSYLRLDPMRNIGLS